MDEMFYNKHYIAVDERSRIVAGWSDGIHPSRDTSNAICINEQGGRQFRLFQNSEENPLLFNGIHMIPLYRWDGTQVIRRTAEEIDADVAALSKPKQIPSERDDTAAMLVDHEFRLTLLELGVV